MEKRYLVVVTDNSDNENFIAILNSRLFKTKEDAKFATDASMELDEEDWDFSYSDPILVLVD